MQRWRADNGGMTACLLAIVQSAGGDGPVAADPPAAAKGRVTGGRRAVHPHQLRRGARSIVIALGAAIGVALGIDWRELIGRP
jgi:hypothetical protein